MVTLNYSDLAPAQSSSDRPNIGFFSLKDDGNEAIVRFMHNSIEDIKILPVHDITLNGKYRKVNCLRTPSEPLGKCPLCESGAKLTNKIYINLIQYTQDEAGNVVASPKIWELSAKVYYPQFKSLFENYGPLSENIFKVHRSGARGDTNTKYMTMFLPPANFPPEKFVKTNDFDNYSVVGGLVIDRPYEDVLTFVQTGNFPAKKSTSDADVIPFDSPQGQAIMNAQTAAFNPAPTPVAPTPAPASSQAAFGDVPWATPAQAVEKPARFY